MTPRATELRRCYKSQLLSDPRAGRQRLRAQRSWEVARIPRTPLLPGMRRNWDTSVYSGPVEGRPIAACASTLDMRSTKWALQSGPKSMSSPPPSRTSTRQMTSESDMSPTDRSPAGSRGLVICFCASLLIDRKFWSRTLSPVERATSRPSSSRPRPEQPGRAVTRNP
jgi:hypothetical protein